MKNKIIRGGCQLNLISKKKALSKNAQKMQKLSDIEKFFTRHFTKFVFLEQVTAMPQFNMQNMLLFFSLSKQSS